MKVTVWEKKNVVIYIGGDPEKNIPPVITLEMVDPQIAWDTNKNVMIIKETK